LLYSAISFAFFIVPVFIGTHRSKEKETRCENGGGFGFGGGRGKKEKPQQTPTKLGT